MINSISLFIDLQGYTVLSKEKNLSFFLLSSVPISWAEYVTRSIFKWSQADLNWGFSFSYTSSLTKAKEPCLLYYFPLAEGWIDGFMSLPKALACCEKQMSFIFFNNNSGHLQKVFYNLWLTKKSPDLHKWNFFSINTLH